MGQEGPGGTAPRFPSGLARAVVVETTLPRHQRAAYQLRRVIDIDNHTQSSCSDSTRLTRSHRPGAGCEAARACMVESSTAARFCWAPTHW